MGAQTKTTGNAKTAQYRTTGRENLINQQKRKQNTSQKHRKKQEKDEKKLQKKNCTVRDSNPGLAPQCLYSGCQSLPRSNLCVLGLPALDNTCCEVRALNHCANRAVVCSLWRGTKELVYIPRGKSWGQRQRSGDTAGTLRETLRETLDRTCPFLGSGWDTRRAGQQDGT